MPAMLRAALIAASLTTILTLPAAAQQATPLPAPAPAAPAQQPVVLSLTAEQIGAIVVGAAAGAVLLGGGMARLTGAAIGGFVGYWIYSQPAPAKAPLAG